ncbi:hypothetical protein MLD38_029468 [Melastoma candidum]|uniref:Uncharacterized protein n=1 Tax=Melastoma candidum TaxID=119954 RepID=A0ACB9N488_9MYRT|nr:hypothetical protein MLD38_029468 [Melastoma candidum]
MSSRLRRSTSQSTRGSRAPGASLLTPSSVTSTTTTSRSRATSASPASATGPRGSLRNIPVGGTTRKPGRKNNPRRSLAPAPRPTLTGRLLKDVAVQGPSANRSGLVPSCCEVLAVNVS